MNLKALREFCSSRKERQILEAKIKTGTSKEASKLLNIPRRTVDDNLKRIENRAVERGYSPDHDMTKPTAPGFAVNGISTLYDDDGNIKQQWVKTKAKHQDQLEALTEFVDVLCQDIKPTKPIKKPKLKTNDLLTVYPFGDPHIGLATYFSETGEDYTLDKAELLFTTAMERAVEKAPASKEALIVNVGDYFHSDNAQNRTRQSGNPLDTSGAFADRLQIGTRIMVSIIDKALRKHEKVTVINTIGNHDEHMSIALAAILATFYRDEPRLHIPLVSRAYQFHQFGKCLFGVTHGDQCKPADLEGIMAADMSKAWGETIFRYWFTGHIHHDVIKEFKGCKFESFRTLAPKDAWHSNKGYRSDRDLKVIVYHKDHGEVERYTINISQFSDVFKEYVA